jgi:hypothetical protein
MAMSPEPNRPARDRELLVEAAATAYRERDALGRILVSPAFLDLSPADRDTLFAEQLGSRIIERAVDPAGLSSTAHSVLARLPFISQLLP